MAPNIFGLVGGNGLTNPLTENLEGDGYDIEDIDTLKLNGFEAQTGTFIEVKSDLDMNAFKLFDLADPVAGQDAVTLAYGEANFASSATVPDTAPYDLYVAVTGETTVLTNGVAPIKFNVPRGFTPSSYKCYLATAPSASTAQVILRVNGVDTGTSCLFSVGGVVSTSDTFTSPLTQDWLLEFEIVTTDTTCAGLKVVIQGDVSI